MLFRIKTRKYKKEKIILLLENKTVYLQIEIYIEQLQQRFLKSDFAKEISCILENGMLQYISY